MKTRKDAQLDALMELHRRTLAVLQPSVPYTPYIGPYVPPTIQPNPWGPNTTPIGPVTMCGDDLRTAPFGGLPGSGGMTCEGKTGFMQMDSSRTTDVVGVGG